MLEQFSERVAVLVKAEPLPSQKYGETVCSAGLTANGEWRRLFPIRYRQLPKEKRFNRWDWVEFTARPPTSDHRPESRHVWEDKLRINGAVKDKERGRLIDRAIRTSLSEATVRGESLCILRPAVGDFKFSHRRRTDAELEKDRNRRRKRVSQTSFLDETLDALEPCPFQFRARVTAGGVRHEFTCGDWETDAMFWRFSRSSGEAAALERMDQVFNVEYPRSGMALALGTMASRPKTWMLLGIIRADTEIQADLF